MYFIKRRGGWAARALRRGRFHGLALLGCAAAVGLTHAQSPAAPETETERERMQRQLNQQVLAAPFSVADQAKIDAYVKNATEQKLVPVPTAPDYWRPGYTCASIAGYGWQAYGNCFYYHRYYGRYWY